MNSKGDLKKLNDLEKLRVLLKSLKTIKNEEIYRCESFSIYVTFFLSTEIFTNNYNVKDFLDKNSEFKSFAQKYEMDLKDYLFKSRTNLVGRLIRIIEKAEINDLKTIINVIYDIAFFEIKSSSSKNSSNFKTKGNYYDSLLEQFKRGN